MKEPITEAYSQTLIARLPHREPMRLIHTIRALSETTATCETTANSQIAQLFSKENALDSLIGIELIAQSAAIPLIGNQSSANKPMAGMLIQVKDYSINQPTIPLDSTLSTTIKIDAQPDSVFVIASGEVSVNESVICEGTVTLAVQQ